ncbi:MAG: SpoIVB peptidase [Bacilli bacterium]|nr:SpoIVB peptidase [Bacilli bacterium]
MFFKKTKKFFISLLLSLFIIPNNILAYSDYIIPGGENIGITINSKGIMIVGTYKINGKNTVSSSNLKIGDIIKKIDNKDVNTINEMVKILDNYENNSISITYSRNNKENTTNLDLIREDNTVKTGLYVKDSITGIGTLSFIDPNTKLFGALGHEVSEKNTGTILEVKDGKIFESEVTNIDRSSNGNPGSKNATLNTNNIKGNIKENTTSGIFGTYTSELPNKEKYKVAKISDIKLGKAKILTVLDKDNINEYEINIIKINKNSKNNKNILFKITDEKLINKTGGVVQGMSGSPIIQGDYIIGAVTHVVIDNPINGYGIFITTMLEEAEK